MGTRHILIFHDSHCGLCRSTMRMLTRLDWFGRLQPVDIHDEKVRTRLAPDLRYEDLDRTMHIRLADGSTFTGFEAFRKLSHELPLLWFLLPFLYLPGAAWIGEKIYRRIAERRKACTHETCASPIGPHRGRMIVAGFFAALLCAGLLSVGDYGIPYDEGTMDSLGHDAYAYVFQGKPWPTTVEWRYHGTVVELPLHTLVKSACNLGSTCAILLRHFVDFLLFFIGVAFFYLLGKKCFNDWKPALLGSVMLVLSPRIFASAFYNSRDIPNMVFFIISAYTLLLFVEKKTYRAAVVHGLACALALSIRMTGIILPVFTILLLGLSLLREGSMPHRGTLLRHAGLFSIYLLCTALCTVALWPFLWEHPVQHFMDAYHFMGSLTSTNWFMGRAVTGNPWYYIVVWIAVSTPIIYTLLFVVGSTWAIARCVLPWRMTRKELPAALALAWFFLPILAIIVTKAGIYTEWRHVFFVYPAFILLGLFGLTMLVQFFRALAHTHGRWLRHVPAGIVAAQLLLTGTWMMRNHPFAHSYFAMRTPAMAQNFGIDAWGLAYLQAVAFVHTYDKSDAVSFYATSNLANVDSHLFFPQDRDRVFPVNKAEFAQYLIAHHEPDRPSPFAGRPRLWSAVVDGVALVTVYKGDFDPSAIAPDMRDALQEALNSRPSM